MEQLIDVGIIGGGPAGMNAALVLGRARKSVVVIDEERPRNRVTRESTVFLPEMASVQVNFGELRRSRLTRIPQSILWRMLL